MFRRHLTHLSDSINKGMEILTREGTHYIHTYIFKTGPSGIFITTQELFIIMNPSKASKKFRISRLKTYHEQTAPLKDYYSAQGKLVTVEGQESVEETSKLTLAAIKG